MPFRADESISDGRYRTEKYLLSHLTPSEQEVSKIKLNEIFETLGPVVDWYPTWHPLVRNKVNDLEENLTPNPSCGYHGLDHTRYFANGFITCPYDDGEKVIDSVRNLVQATGVAYIEAERLTEKFYSSSATAILVQCHWIKDLADDGTVPLSIAAPLLIESQLHNWETSQVAETWETMREYFLGRPAGKRSSLIVNQETGQGLKKLWESLIKTGMFGPVYNR